MANPSQKTAKTRQFGRFDRSFFFRLVASFLLLTLAVVAVETGLRFAVVLYQFQVEAPETTEQSSEALAADIRTIMLNRGGPVAARTVYPIIERNFRETGLQIAIEPSALTTEAIETMFSFTPRGIPANWPTGRHVEAVTVLRAEEFCIQCHTNASVGDALGTVVARDYLATRLRSLWGDLQLSGAMNLLKIVLHAVILFFLIRRLLGPLSSLKSAVARLARGEAGVSQRAEVVSDDEFGALAHDLNIFLDRVDGILSDLEESISGLGEVGARFDSVTLRATEQIKQLEIEVRGAGNPALVHRVHEVRHALNEMKQLEGRMREVERVGRRLLESLAT